MGRDKTDIELVKLLPNTAYGISVLALHGALASEPLSDQGVTCMWLTNKYGFLWGLLTFTADRHKSPCRSVPLPPSGQLRVRDVTHSTINLDWDAAPGPVEKYLVTYKPENGEAKEVSSCSVLSCPVLPGGVI